MIRSSSRGKYYHVIVYKVTNRNKTKQLDGVLLRTDIFTVLTVAEEGTDTVEPLLR